MDLKKKAKIKKLHVNIYTHMPTYDVDQKNSFKRIPTLIPFAYR